MTLSVRHADRDDLVAVMRLFDGALLETNADRLNRQLAGEGGCVLCGSFSSRPVGAIALTTEPVADRPAAWSNAVHITAIAVTRSRRGQGIGHKLINAAVDWAAPQSLSATFDERVRPFYTACGFAIEEHDGRLWGVWSPLKAD